MFTRTNILKMFISTTIILILTLLYVIRQYHIGTDTIEYVYYFEALGSMSSISQTIQYSVFRGFEIGFSVLSYLLFSLVAQPAFLFGIYILIMYFSYLKAFAMSNLNLVLLLGSLFSYFPMYYNSFNILRQSIAVALVVLACQYLISDKKSKFFIITVLALFFFHYSAIVCLGFYFVWKFKDLLFRLWYVNLFSTVIISSTALLYLTSNFVKYETYAVKDSVTTTLSPLLFGFYVLILAASILFSRIVPTTLKPQYKFYSVIFTFFIGLQVFFYINPFVNQALIRLAFYFMWAGPFIIGILLLSINDKSIRYFLNTLLFAFICFYFIYSSLHQDVEMVPYMMHFHFNIL